MIDWEKIKSVDNNLYCYSLCVQDNKIVRSRAYYHSNKFIQGYNLNKLLNNLISSGLARCFSYGKDIDADYLKYDLHIYPVDTKKVYTHLKRIRFFDFKKINFFYEISHLFNFKFFNRTIGAKVSLNNSLQNLCIYFSNSEKLGLADCKFFLQKLCKEFGLSENFRVPYNTSDCWLYIIAFDFSFSEFKLKFYIECGENFKRGDFLTLFLGSPSYEIVCDIANTNAIVRGFQVAISNHKDVTYNFYLCRQED